MDRNKDFRNANVCICNYHIKLGDPEKYEKTLVQFFACEYSGKLCSCTAEEYLAEPGNTKDKYQPHIHGSMCCKYRLHFP